MISSDKELKAVQGQIEYLQAAKVRSLQATDATPFQRELGAAGFQKMIDRLEDEIAEFEQQSKASSVPIAAS
jgi:hypothetical protein